ncbi:MAG: hypothetical protein JOY62_17870 [Acidobacteriaceae bacterium]|nr:hypothetical protein [Acidobacteriaceae bacterium]MBV9781834.1 hypothetical protein [Acidobacteriaceae bacterium]
MTQTNKQNLSESLRPGDWVQVRSFQEISATLDAAGKLNGLPFMPEMVQFCGKTFQVAKRAEKTCFGHRQRRFANAVHLADLRCDGSAHDGCQLRCLLFWREEWLQRAPGPAPEGIGTVCISSNGSHSNLVTRQILPNRDVRYVCQATEIGKISTEVKPWNVSQYFREIRTGNLRAGEIKQVFRWFLTWLEWRFFKATSTKQATPVFERQSVSIGDLVEVRPKKEIFQTLTNRGQNFGLSFSTEMLMLCGNRYHVVNQVRQIIDEETGKMLYMKRSCLTLDSVTCKGGFQCCPRANYYFWRDEWLKKIEAPQA